MDRKVVKQLDTLRTVCSIFVVITPFRDHCFSWLTLISKNDHFHFWEQVTFCIEFYMRGGSGKTKWEAELIMYYTLVNVGLIILKMTSYERGEKDKMEDGLLMSCCVIYLFMNIVQQSQRIREAWADRARSFWMNLFWMARALRTRSMKKWYWPSFAVIVSKLHCACLFVLL